MVDWAAGSGHVAVVAGSAGQGMGLGFEVGSSATWRGSEPVVRVGKSAEAVGPAAGEAAADSGAGVGAAGFGGLAALPAKKPELPSG